ncbi:MAG TPA: YggT family protein [Rhizomicrobium sp.]|nr:YggT family protein [Rhizomicrobium sp.]
MFENPFIALALYLIEIYQWVVIAAVIASWLVVFNVINARNEIVRGILRFLDAVTEPVFRQIRRVIPPIGGIDLSPLIVLIALWFLAKLIVWAAFNFGIY